MAVRRSQIGEHHGGLAVAVEIRCAGRGGRCRMLRGRALVLPVESRGDSLLLLTNEGSPWHKRTGARLESLVGSKFDGAADTLFCADQEHDERVSGVASGPEVRTLSGRTLAVGKTLSSGRLALPHGLLRAPYRAFLRTGQTQVLTWTVTGADV